MPGYDADRDCWANAAADPHQTPAEAQDWHALASALHRITERAAAADLGIALSEDLSTWAAVVIPVGRLSFPAGRVIARLHRAEGLAPIATDSRPANPLDG